MYNCCTIDKKILHICRCEYRYFLSKANVVGVALSYKIKNGFYTCEKCIKVYVSRKVPINQLTINNVIPACYKGIPTDVEQSGKFRTCSLRNRVRPVTGGYNIGPSDTDKSGTMGCLVADNMFYYILSNNHLLAANGDMPIGKPIIQPSGKWGGHAPVDVVANLFKYIPVKVITPTIKPENFVDCAIASVSEQSQVSHKITFLGDIKGITSPALGQDVQKVGATSELTKGKITAIGATKYVEFLKQECLFKDQIITTKMGGTGDSGAILLDDNMNAIGLLMACTASKVAFNPITTVLTSLNVGIVIGH